MTTAFLIWWWVFLVAALLVTLVDVYLLLRVVSLSRQIYTLSSRTAMAAPTIAGHTAAGAELNRLVALVNALATKAEDLARFTDPLGQRLTQSGRSSC